MSKYEYADPADVEKASDIEAALRKTVFNYLHDQLGWSSERCEQRIEKELNRDIPRTILDVLERRRGWLFTDARLLDVGAEQGGAVLEALDRGPMSTG